MEGRCVEFIYRVVDSVADVVLRNEEYVSRRVLGEKQRLAVYPVLVDRLEEILQGWYGIEAGDLWGFVPVAARRQNNR